MFSSARKELKDNLSDRIRGLRCIVRALGSNEVRSRLAPTDFIGVLPAVDRVVGKTFRTIDGIMSVVESAAGPMYPISPTFNGFQQVEKYGRTQGIQRLQEDLYAGLKALASVKSPNSIISKRKLSSVADALSMFVDKMSSGPFAAQLLFSLNRENPLVDLTGEQQETDAKIVYIALALLFGASAFSRIEQQETVSLLYDALLLAEAKMDAITPLLNDGVAPGLLAEVVEMQIRHLA